MPNIEIRPAHLHHCGPLARSMRAAQREGGAALGFDGHRELRRRFDESYLRREYLIDGRLVAMGGAVAGLAEPIAFVWLAVSHIAAHYPVRVAREALRQLDDILTLKNRLQTIIVESDERSFVFAELLGFREIGRGDGMVVVEKTRIVSPFAEVNAPWLQ